MTSVTVTISPPVSFILRQSGEFRRRLSNLSELWDRLKPIISEIEQERFQTQGYGEWPGWSPNTRVHGDRLLHLTGALEESLVDPGQAVLEESAMSMTWGTGVEYAGYHQDGGSVPGRPPQRVILELRGEDRARIEPEIVGWLNQVAAETWGAI